MQHPARRVYRVTFRSFLRISSKAVPVVIDNDGAIRRAAPAPRWEGLGQDSLLLRVLAGFLDRERTRLLLPAFLLPLKLDALGNL